MTKRTRSRGSIAQRAAERAAQVRREHLVCDASELLTLWRAMPAAVARDSAGQLTGDRHASGAVKGSAASVNLDVVQNAILVEAQVSEFAAEATAILNLGRGRWSTTVVIAAIPDWHLALSARESGRPLAAQLEKGLGRWLRWTKLAIGVQRHDERLGYLCPDHRDDDPTELLIEGARATLAPSLLAGPPANGWLHPGPLCRHRWSEPCEHDTCRWALERRILVGRKPTDWVDVAGEPTWSPLRDVPAFTWRESGTVICRHCKRAWTTPNERRLLAAELKAAGDQRMTSIGRMLG